jgi:hypothetical protein
MWHNNISTYYTNNLVIDDTLCTFVFVSLQDFTMKSSDFLLAVLLDVIQCSARVK